MKRRRGIPNSSGWRPVGCGCFTEAAGRLQAGWMVPRKNGLQSEEFYGTITHGKEIAGVMELADVTDSKSVGGDTVWVRVPPPAPCPKTSITSKVFGLFLSLQNPSILRKVSLFRLYPSCFGGILGRKNT